jgi:hypothetical protein
VTDCVNGCKTKATDDELPGSRPAVQGLLCSWCVDRLTGWLKDIPVDYALLPMLYESGQGQRMDGAGRTKQTEAPAPVRLDVVALTGRPTHSGVRAPGDELWYELEDIPPVLLIVHAWAEQLRCDLDPSREYQDTQGRTVVGECRYLLKASLRLSERPWIDDCMAELQTVWVWLTRVHGLLVGDSLGDCFTVGCDGKVYRDRYTGFPACRKCKRSYDGIDAVRLRLTEEAAQV